MARSNIRVLALDLDGTLTNDEKIVTAGRKLSLAEVKELLKQ